MMFLGFANFYHCFNANFNKISSQVSVPGINCQLSIPPTEGGLHHHSHTGPTIARTALLRGGGCINNRSGSSVWGSPRKLRHYTYLSRKLSLLEQNYDIGDRDLLAIKLALEEWRHWLEGAKHLFEFITLHHNLECLWEARRLKP